MHPLRLHLVPAEGSVRQSSDKRAREHTTISIFNTLLEWDVELGKRSGLPARSLSHFLRLLSVQGRSGIRSELKMQLKRWKQTSFSDRIQILFSIPPFILPVQHRHQRHHNFLLLLEFCNNSNSTEPIPFQKAIYIFCLSPCAFALYTKPNMLLIFVSFGVQKTEEKLKFCFLVGRKLVCLCWRWSTIQPQRQYAESLQFLFFKLMFIGRGAWSIEIVPGRCTRDGEAKAREHNQNNIPI